MKEKKGTGRDKKGWAKMLTDKETYFLAKEWLTKVYRQPSRVLRAPRPKD